MKLVIRVVRRETQKAVQVIVADWPYRIHWIPRSQIKGDLHAGDRDIEVEIPAWLQRRMKEEYSQN